MSEDEIKPGEQLTLAQINRIRKANEAKATSKAGNGGIPADGAEDAPGKLTVAELRDELTARGIEIPEGAKKADLQALLADSD